MKKKPTQIQILSSKNYELFSDHGFQRLIKTVKVQKLMAEMQKHGFRADHPIGVVKEGKGYRIIDGHHRFKAAMELGIPILFVILRPELDEAMDTGNIGTPWNASDTMRKYVLRENPHYITLSYYVGQGIPLMMAAGMLGGQGAGSGGNFSEAIREGRFIVKTTHQCDAIVGLRNDFGEGCPAVKTSQFVRAISLCLMLHEFDLKQFRARLSKNPKGLPRCSTHLQMLECIESVYNTGSRSRIPLAFIATEAAVARQANIDARHRGSSTQSGELFPASDVTRQAKSKPSTGSRPSA